MSYIVFKKIFRTVIAILATSKINKDNSKKTME